MKTQFAAERAIDAPADVIYHLLADYREHHRPEGFLPPAFSDQEILAGGVGAGTELRYTLTLGGRPRVVTSRISEPEPGRTMVETAEGILTTITVEPGTAGHGSNSTRSSRTAASRVFSPGCSLRGSSRRSTRTSSTGSRRSRSRTRPIDAGAHAAA